MQVRRYSLFDIVNKKDNEIYSLVIEVNRLLAQMSKRELCEDICSVQRYETFISDRLSLPEELAFPLMEKLGIMYMGNETFIDNGISIMSSFIEEHMFNEFDQALWRYNEIEAAEEKYLSSPLIVEYLLVKLAYHSVHDRDVFNHTLSVLKMALPLLERNQKFLFYLYMGIDAFKNLHEPRTARECLDQARVYGGHPHVYTWIGILDLNEGKVVSAVKMFEKAQRRYINDGNLVGIIFTTELIGLSYYRENDYESGIDIFRGALGYAKTLDREYLVSNFKNQIAWGYFRLHDYDRAMATLVKDRYNNDFTVNSSVTTFLIAYHLGDEELMRELKKEFSNRNKTLHRMICSVIMKEELFDEEGELIIDEDELKALLDLASITHFELKKEFEGILLGHYIRNNNCRGLMEVAKSSLIMGELC